MTLELLNYSCSPSSSVSANQYEAEKQKNKALEDIQIKHKQNMERMTKIVGDYKSELDKARKELKDAKGKK